MDKKVRIRKTNQMLSCNLCGASTYESSVCKSEQIEYINELIIGQQGSNLCDNCLDKLIDILLKHKEEL